MSSAQDSQLTPEQVPKLTIYLDYASQPSRAIRTICDLFKITDKIEWKLIKLLKRENTTPEYLKINPFHTVPCLVDNDSGLVIYESPAIVEYLDEVFGLDGPFGFPARSKRKERFQVITALHKHHSLIRNTTMTILTPWFASFVFKKPFDVEAFSKIVAHAKANEYSTLNTILANNNGYICGGEQPSAADVFAFMEVFQFTKGDFEDDDCNTHHVCDFEDLPAVHAWLQKLRPILFDPARETDLWEGTRSFIKLGRSCVPLCALLNASPSKL